MCTQPPDEDEDDDNDADDGKDEEDESSASGRHEIVTRSHRIGTLRLSRCACAACTCGVVINSPSASTSPTAASKVRPATAAEEKDEEADEDEEAVEMEDAKVEDKVEEVAAVEKLTEADDGGGSVAEAAAGDLRVLGRRKDRGD